MLLSITPLVALSIITYSQRAESIKEREFNKLSAIRDLKVSQINEWLRERVVDISVICEDSYIRGLEFTANDQFSDKKAAALREILNKYNDIYNFYEEISILNPKSGRVMVSTNRLFEGETRYDKPYFSELLKTEKIYIGDIYFSERLNKPTMTISGPILFGNSGKSDIAGIMLCRIDLRRANEALFVEPVGLGKTGEMFIINKDQIVLSDVRWSSGAPLKLKLSSRYSVEAAKGLTGIIENTDYRSKDVLSAYTYIPSARWGFIVKQDLEEVYSAIFSLLINFAILLIVTVIAVYFIANLLAKSLSRPIIEIKNTSKRIQEGDLTARNSIAGSDELGDLAGTINSLADFMVGRIKIQRDSAEIIETIATVDELSDFRKKLLLKLMEISGADFGAYYRLNKDDSRFHLFTSVGVNAEALQPFNAASAEGVFSIALVNKRIEYLKEIPYDSRFVFRTVAGDIFPREIITIPLIIEGEVRGFVNLGKISNFSALTLEILQQIWQSINNALSNLLAHIETRRLADELNLKNVELMVKSEEMARQAEVLERQSGILRAQNVELEEQRRKVEEANRLKTEFLSNMSHELRTPLNSILALSRVLIMQAGGRLTDDEKNYLNIIDRNGKNLLNLINDILDLSKIEMGRVEAKVAPVRTGDLIRSIVENIEAVAEEKKLDIVQNIPARLPDIESDEGLLRQILQNIISNAVKFTEKGMVKISAIDAGDKVVIGIEDTGIGISEKNLNRIFDEFWQADGSNTRKYDGTGLGLSISYKIAKILNAEIEVKSELARGSVFSVSLPVRWKGGGGISPRPALGVEQRHRKKILIIDDNPEIVRLISDYLREEGYDPVPALSGAAALDAARREKPYAVTLDILMPGMDGWEVLQNLKNDPETSNIPVIIISVSENIETGAALGAVGYVSKPVRKQKLIEEIENISLRRGGDNRRKIMIIDDSEIDRSEMSRIVSEQGMDVVLAGGGRESLNLLESVSPDVIVLDLMMPEVNGFEVLKRIRTNPATGGIPVIIVTAKDLTAADRKRLAGNVAAIVRKADPTFGSLLIEIKKILQVIGEQPQGCPGAGGMQAPGKISSAGNERSRILIIEDNPDNMVTARAILGNQYDIMEAADGEAGLRMIFQNRPDLVLLDISLPNISGYDVLKRIRTSDGTRDIPVIAMTAHAMKGDREKMMEEGCDDYVPKPINPDELTEKVKTILCARRNALYTKLQ